MSSSATTPVKFGRQTVQRLPFSINELEFASTPLSLAEERRLAAAGTPEDEAQLMDALLAVLADILNGRSDDDVVNPTWLMDNLTSTDLEGIVEHLRSGSAEEG